MASSGLVMTIRMQSGTRSRTSPATLATMPALILIRSSRLMPGRRGEPAVSTTMSEPASSA